jgi:rare lipoprotein A
MPSKVIMGADLTAGQAAAPRENWRFSADVNAATRLPSRLRQKNKIARDAFTPRPRAIDREGESTMNRIAPVATTLVCLAGAAHAAQEQQVRATWYGNELRGNRTASGEIFNPGGLTAAHKSLPFGTCLVVGNPKTGKSVAVRVNDRGPFTAGLTLDLSHGAARAIGMHSTQSVTMKRC